MLRASGFAVISQDINGADVVAASQRDLLDPVLYEHVQIDDLAEAARNFVEQGGPVGFDHYQGDDAIIGRVVESLVFTPATIDALGLAGIVPQGWWCTVEIPEEPFKLIFDGFEPGDLGFSIEFARRLSSELGRGATKETPARLRPVIKRLDLVTQPQAVPGAVVLHYETDPPPTAVQMTARKLAHKRLDLAKVAAVVDAIGAPAEPEFSAIDTATDAGLTAQHFDLDDPDELARFLALMDDDEGEAVG